MTGILSTTILTALFLVALAFDPRLAQTERLLILGLLFLAIALRLVQLMRKKSNSNELLVLGIFTLLAFLEGGFHFVARSQGFSQSLSAWNWRQKYWVPTLNENGFRDVRRIPQEFQSKKIAIALGDSMTAGAGIKNPADRYSNLLETSLGQDWIVLNRAVSGIDTREEIEILKKFEVKPNLILLGYYGNDIDRTAAEHGLKVPRFVYQESLGPIARWMVGQSHFVNFLYWQSPKPYSEQYREFLKQAFENPKIRERHFQDLFTLHQMARKHQIPLLVVVFPFMGLDEKESFYLPWIREYLNNKKIAFLDVSQSFEKIPIERRIINSNDHHPSTEVHAWVAAKIKDWLILNQVIQGLSTSPLSHVPKPVR